MFGRKLEMGCGSVVPNNVGILKRVPILVMVIYNMFV